MTMASVNTKGSLVRIKLTNFLTYDSVEFKTGPHLNVIIGPNGTGKSAIVCAICLGLAGKTAWLGRASDPKDFIKFRKQEARIEIELFNEPENYVIVREINKANTSRWLINGRNATQKSVEQAVARLNIQVGNLCQVLPQEKVADFAKMTQQELLENTEKSVGIHELYENHQKLKQARQEAKSLEQDLTNTENRLDQEKQKNARLEQDVKCFNDRKTFLEKVEVLRMKKPWLEYDFLKKQYLDTKTEKDGKSDELKTEKKKYAPLERRQEALRMEKGKLEQDTREMSQRIREKMKKTEDHITKMNNKSEKIEEAKTDYESKLSEEEARKRRINDLQEQVKALETGLVQLESCDDQKIAKSIEKTAYDLRSVGEKMNSVQNDGESLQREIKALNTELRAFEGQLRQIKDVNNRRLETLRSLHQNTYEAVVWLRANSHLFNKTIHEPMIISEVTVKKVMLINNNLLSSVPIEGDEFVPQELFELNVNNPKDARLVETHISFNDLRSFVCEDPDDLDLFMSKMKEQKLKVNTIRMPDKPANSFKPQNPISHYKKYGFLRYMQSLFTCPEPVMRYLCLMYKVYAIPIGDAGVKNNSELITSHCPELTTFYTPEVQYAIKKSKYSNNVSSRNTALREARALTDSVNSQRELELADQIKTLQQDVEQKTKEYKALQAKCEEYEASINELREKKRSLFKQRDQRKNIENQIITKKQRMEQVKRETIDLDAEKEKLNKQLQKIIAEKCQHLNQSKLSAEECLDLAKSRMRSSLKLYQQNVKYNSLEGEVRNAKQRTEALEREVQHLKLLTDEKKQEARLKLVEAMKMSSIKSQEDLQGELTRRGMWEEFTDAPSNLEELDIEIHSMQARAESMFQVDEKVVKEYEERQKEIEDMEQVLRERETRRLTHQEDIAEIRQRWLTPLNKLIGEINTNFSYFFSCIQCCGEVGLNVPENVEDYEKYGISIKVKFRDDENLRELTAYHQSGGERSVSTVLYMLAMQELIKCPFRIVDEINQGMDPKNERKVFELVVQTVCKKNSSQYFLLTPKLLQDLDYDDNMTVLCVYNGPEMMSHKQWYLPRLIQRRSTLEA